MAAHQIKYEGPSSLAVRAATMLADADGVELISSRGLERRDEGDDKVLMALTVEGTAEAIIAAVRLVGESLPRQATITIVQSMNNGP
jgi:hypothetical protein